MAMSLSREYTDRLPRDENKQVESYEMRRLSRDDKPHCGAERGGFAVAIPHRSANVTVTCKGKMAIRPGGTGMSEKAGDAKTPLEVEVGERMSEDRRQLLKLILGSMAAYSTPLIASFSMEGLRIGSAEAGFQPPGLSVANQLSGLFQSGRPFEAGNQPPGQPFASNQTLPGVPFIP